jgi:hypothetical protein
MMPSVDLTGVNRHWHCPCQSPQRPVRRLDALPPPPIPHSPFVNENAAERMLFNQHAPCGGQNVFK